MTWFQVSSAEDSEEVSQTVLSFVDLHRLQYEFFTVWEDVSSNDSEEEVYLLP